MALLQALAERTHCATSVALVAHGHAAQSNLPDLRVETRACTTAAVASFAVEGIHTTIPFHRDALGHRDFREAQITTRWMENDFLWGRKSEI